MSHSIPMDPDRRRWLTATSVAGGAGVVATSVPFVASMDRSVKPELSVMVGLCTHLGCIPTFRPVPGAADLGANWPGGFFCPCHGSKFDLAGRVFKTVPAPTNLEVPAHHFAGANRLLIGVDPIG